MEKLKSEGKCYFCDKHYSQAGISRHLKTHINSFEKDETYKKGESFTIKAKAAEMFLVLWVSSTATFGDVDSFLRDIWLECCGHMSAFTDKKLANSQRGNMDFNFGMDEEMPGEIKMSKKIKAIFEEKKTLDYEYDFGSTTYVEIKFLNRFEVKAPKKVVLLSRNEPLELLCHRCGKEPAIHISTTEEWGNNMFCKKCSKKHEKENADFEEYGKAPVVNSPRMGTCAYEGGTIDTKRDGAFTL